MSKLKLLVLTDHSNHSVENALYNFMQIMCAHPSCAQLDVATRANDKNDVFFLKQIGVVVFAAKVDGSFAFSQTGEAFTKHVRKVSLHDYDAVWLRLPPPLSKSFIDFLSAAFPDLLIINKPTGIYKTGSKAFLTNFSKWCAPIKPCFTVDNIIAFKNRFPIVLKPFREYGGRGIVRIDGEQVWEGVEEMTFDHFITKIKDTEIAYLGVKFLKNVTEGDKRIVVVDGHIMGASLRLPPKDSWLCNVAMGGSSHFATVDEVEKKMIAAINPILSDLGIVMYGIDTLVDDEGTRVLSEINTTSIGGLPQIATYRNEPLVEKAADLIFNYILKNKK